MSNYRRPSLRERIAAYMAGRYGIDRLFYFLLAIHFILIVTNLFFRSYIIIVAESAVLTYALYRVLSRNIYKRQQENEKINSVFEKVKEFVNFQKCKINDRKTHVYKKCPSCHNNLRLPKKKGNHTVVCPCCKHRFDVKIKRDAGASDKTENK